MVEATVATARVVTPAEVVVLVAVAQEMVWLANTTTLTNTLYLSRLRALLRLL